MARPAARRRRLRTVPLPGRLARRSARRARRVPIEAVRLALRVHGRSQLRPVSWQDWRRTELNLAARATTNQPAAHQLRIGARERVIGRWMRSCWNLTVTWRDRCSLLTMGSSLSAGAAAGPAPGSQPETPEVPDAHHDSVRCARPGGACVHEYRAAGVGRIPRGIQRPDPRGVTSWTCGSMQAGVSSTTCACVVGALPDRRSALASTPCPRLRGIPRPEVNDPLAEGLGAVFAGSGTRS
jgi:hypothetical protein